MLHKQKRNKPNNQYVFFKGENALLQKYLANRIKVCFAGSNV